jgi:hypothetical protein
VAAPRACHLPSPLRLASSHACLWPPFVPSLIGKNRERRGHLYTLDYEIIFIACQGCRALTDGQTWLYTHRRDGQWRLQSVVSDVFLEIVFRRAGEYGE